VNLEALWASAEFAQLSLDIQVVSPQLVTHAHMVNVMAAQYAGRQHVLGGEVRYRTNYLKDDNSFANIVLLTKVAPGYNGLLYSARSDGGGTGTPVTSASVTLDFDGFGNWTVNAVDDSNISGGNPTGGPRNGSFAVAPFNPAGYEVRVIAVAGINITNLGTVSPLGPTAWSNTASFGGVTVTADADFSTYNTSNTNATFYFELRGIGTGTVMASNISLDVYNHY
jgi:hypothetical protein